MSGRGGERCFSAVHSITPIISDRWDELWRRRQTEFFLWFHLEETQRQAEKPGEAVRFRPSGPKFHDLCYLDTLIAATGELVRIELVVTRTYIDGTDGIFAQGLVKSFLLAALPDACRDILRDFTGEIAELPTGRGRTPGYLVFRGRQNAWRKQTGWSRLLLANLPLPDGPALVVQVGPNPSAPNARLIGGKAKSERHGGQSRLACKQELTSDRAIRGAHHDRHKGYRKMFNRASACSKLLSRLRQLVELAQSGIHQLFACSRQQRRRDDFIVSLRIRLAVRNIAQSSVSKFGSDSNGKG